MKLALIADGHEKFETPNLIGSMRFCSDNADAQTDGRRFYVINAIAG
jgi:hypothetical protein